MKTQVNMTIDTEVIKEVRKLGINVSSVVEEFLRGLLSGKDDEEMIIEYLKQLNEGIDEMDKVRKRAEEAIIKGNKKLLEIRKQKEEREKRLLEIFDKIPEAQNLTREQITNTDLLLKLVGVIREKYGVRIGVTDIREYYKIKDREMKESSTKESSKELDTSSGDVPNVGHTKQV